MMYMIQKGLLMKSHRPPILVLPPVERSNSYPLLMLYELRINYLATKTQVSPSAKLA